jgi:hypothetical protein
MLVILTLPDHGKFSKMIWEMAIVLRYVDLSASDQSYTAQATTPIFIDLVGHQYPKAFSA